MTQSAPIIVIGSGPVGLRCAQELLNQHTEHKVQLFSQEQWQPYNRVRLSGFLGGQYDYEDISLPALEGFAERFETHLGQAITYIDRDKQQIQTADGKWHAYSQLVLATGSHAHLPTIEGIEKTGVYTFRNVKDTLALQARQTSARHVVIIGGGLLGLEAARAMRVYNTKVTVIEHTHHLMYQQLDALAGQQLESYIKALKIHVITQDWVKSVLGTERVTGIMLGSGEVLDCDTVIVAAGIRSNLELARQAGLKVGRGITVNDQLQTSDKAIYAVGDCAEHHGIIYGLVAPGYEQAAVASANILGHSAQYLGSTSSTSLKVAGCPVFSIGDVDAMRDTKGEHVYQDQEKGLYRRLHIQRGYLQGVIAIGEWPDKPRLQEAVRQNRLIWPWQRQRFLATGRLWPESEPQAISAWPASAVVCQCTGVTRGQLSLAMEAGCTQIHELRDKTGASSVCGSCKPQLAELLGGQAKTEPTKGWGILAITGFISALLALIYLLFPGAGFQTSVLDFSWDQIWRESINRQISGFVLLGVGLLISLVSVRKRFPKLPLGDFDFWRIGHVLIGTLLLFVLWIHTGARLGENLNLLLMLSFLGTLLAGAILSTSIGQEHRLQPQIAKKIRKTSLWVHLLLLWPLPTLLGFHILKAYYF